MVSAGVAVCAVTAIFLALFMVYTNHYYSLTVTPDEADPIVDWYVDGGGIEALSFLTVSRDSVDGMVYIRRNSANGGHVVMLMGQRYPNPSPQATARFNAALARAISPSPTAQPNLLPNGPDASAKLADLLRQTLGADAQYQWTFTWNMSMGEPEGIDAELVGMLGGILD